MYICSILVPHLWSQPAKTATILDGVGWMQAPRRKQTRKKKEEKKYRNCQEQEGIDKTSRQRYQSGGTTIISDLGGGRLNAGTLRLGEKDAGEAKCH